MLSAAEASITHKTGCETTRANMLICLLTDSITRLRMMYDIQEEVAATLSVFDQHKEDFEEHFLPTECRNAL